MSLYNNIPQELRELRQWINWKKEYVNGNDKPTKIPLRPYDGYKASVTNPLDWSTFGHAVDMAAFCDGIGFVFTKSDPFCGFDLDQADTVEIQSKHNEIYNTLLSYAEYSPSGLGLHIITIATLPGTGRRRNKVECYDANRFFTFTGNIVNQCCIAQRQLEVEAIYNTLGATNVTPLQFVNEPQTVDDQQVVYHATAAVNGEKFKRLYSGDWQTDYPPPIKSQSEADFALINILSFYTKNREQITRLFRASGLGKRDKAQRNAYLNWMIDKSFDRMPPKPDMDNLHNQRLEILHSLGIK